MTATKDLGTIVAKIDADQAFSERIGKLAAALPDDHQPFTDKYFLRTNDILKGEGLNPFVRAQYFIRKGPGTVQGIDEALAILLKYSNIEQNGGRIYALPEGAEYSPKETIMVVEARAQDIVELETMMLGVISAETTKANDGQDIDYAAVTEQAKRVVAAAGDRPVLYFGARHWRYDQDAAIAKAAFDGGFAGTSTDIGAAQIGKKGQGTIPHFLENIFAWKYGRREAVKKATEAFDRHIPNGVPRIALCDYDNHEIDDSLATAKALDGAMWGVRVDTCGENVMQGGLTHYDDEAMRALFGKEVQVPEGDERYWFGNGVTVTGVYALRKAFDHHGGWDQLISLTSGFASPAKVEAFARAEKILGKTLFNSLGAGQLFASRTVTMDVVAVGDTIDTMADIHKVGRPYRPNSRLELVASYGGRT